MSRTNIDVYRLCVQFLCVGSTRNVDLQIKSGSISPDPVPLPGTITVSVNLTLTKTIKAPLKAKVTLQKRVGKLNVTIPCVDNIGSCTYDDLCELIPYQSECPRPLSTYHIPCQCPFAKGNYYLPPYEFDLPDPGGNVPSWLVSGEYHGKAILTDADGDHAGCYEAFLALKLD